MRVIHAESNRDHAHEVKTARMSREDRTKKTEHERLIAFRRAELRPEGNTSLLTNAVSGSVMGRNPFTDFKFPAGRADRNVYTEIAKRISSEIGKPVSELEIAATFTAQELVDTIDDARWVLIAPLVSAGQTTNLIATTMGTNGNVINATIRRVQAKIKNEGPDNPIPADHIPDFLRRQLRTMHESEPDEAGLLVEAPRREEIANRSMKKDDAFLAVIQRIARLEDPFSVPFIRWNGHRRANDTSLRKWSAHLKVTIQTIVSAFNREDNTHELMKKLTERCNELLIAAKAQEIGREELTRRYPALKRKSRFTSAISSAGISSDGFPHSSQRSQPNLRLPRIFGQK